MTIVFLLLGLWVLCALLACLFSVLFGRWKRVAQGMFFTSCVWFVLCSIPASSDVLAWPLRKVAVTCLPISCPKVGAIVVLGGGGGTETGSRIATGVEQHKRGLADWLVLSGGGPGETPEATVMRDAAIGYGVPSQFISIEINSRNTRENALFTAAILRSRGVKIIILVTSIMHMARAKQAFLCQGFLVESASIDEGTVEGTTGWRYLAPSLYSFMRSMKVIKEYIGLTIYFIEELWDIGYARC